MGGAGSTRRRPEPPDLPRRGAPGLGRPVRRGARDVHANPARPRRDARHRSARRRGEQVRRCQGPPRLGGATQRLHRHRTAVREPQVPGVRADHGASGDPRARARQGSTTRRAGRRPAHAATHRRGHHPRGRREPARRAGRPARAAVGRGRPAGADLPLPGDPEPGGLPQGAHRHAAAAGKPQGLATRVHRAALPDDRAGRPTRCASRARGSPHLPGAWLTARFLYSLPPDNVGYREVDPPEIPTAIASAYSEYMLTLARSLAALADAGGEALALTLTDGAAEAHLEFMRTLEGRMNPDTGDLAHPSHVREWTAKLAGAAVRIAGLLHLAEHVRDGWGLPVEAATMRAAVRISEYLIPHALAVFDLMNADEAVADASYVLAWLERAKIEQFKRRDALAALRRFAKVSDLDGPLELLEAHGYIRVEGADQERPKGPGRKPSPTYTVNPLWRQQNQQNQQNPRRVA